MHSAANQLSLFADDEPDALSGFSVRESGRAKRLSIKVFPRGRVEVVVPRRTRAAEVRDFVESHREWIERTRQNFAEEHPPEPFALPMSIRLNAVGIVKRVIYARDDGSRSVNFRNRQDCVVISGRTSDEKLCVGALKRWLVQTAKTQFAPRLRMLSVETGNKFKKMHVRGQRTCWGSHSGSGTISLNYCLLFLDPAEMRYVLIHELCHARHMNHSARFWRHVSEFEPDYRLLDKALNESWKKIPSWVGIY